MEANTEIYKVLLEIKQSMGEMHSDIKATRVQAEKTNGRVTKLEDQMSDRISFETSVKAKVGIVAGLVGLLAGNVNHIINLIRGN